MIYVSEAFNSLTAKLYNWNLHLIEAVLADAIQNFKWVKIIQIWPYLYLFEYRNMFMLLYKWERQV